MRCGVVGCEMSEGDGERGEGEFARVLIVRGGCEVKYMCVMNECYLRGFQGLYQY